MRVRVHTHRRLLSHFETIAGTGSREGQAIVCLCGMAALRRGQSMKAAKGSDVGLKAILILSGGLDAGRLHQG